VERIPSPFREEITEVKGVMGKTLRILREELMVVATMILTWKRNCFLHGMCTASN
jgi:hypothetical protein